MKEKIMKAAAIVLALGMTLGQTLSAKDVITINGAGATFPYPIYSKWFDEYHKKNPNIQINYQSIGSGGGIRQVTAHTVDFGASDGPMSDADLSKVDGKLLHIPTVLGAVAVIYNVEGFSGELKLSGTILADIYLGKITKWNDPALAALNPGVNLPNASIIVVHRSDGSGTSVCFTDYLSNVSAEWKSKVGMGKSVNWPVGLGGKGNEGVAGTVKQTPNSIGYAELIYAKQNNIAMAQIKNKDGKFVEPSIKAVSAAAAGVQMPADYRVSIVNAAGPDTYPISTFTWLLVYQKTGGEKGKIIKDFLNWMLDNGQPLAPSLGYAPLPTKVASMVRKTVSTVR